MSDDGDDDAKNASTEAGEIVLSATVAPVTFVRPAKIKSGMGGKPLVFAQNTGGSVGSNEVSLEDAAAVCVRCLGAPPKPGTVLEFDFANGPGAGGQKRDWRGLFNGLSAN